MIIRASEVFFGLAPVLPFLFVAPIAITAVTLHKKYRRGDSPRASFRRRRR